MSNPEKFLRVWLWILTALCLVGVVMRDDIGAFTVALCALLAFAMNGRQAWPITVAVGLGGIVLFFGLYDGFALGDWISIGAHSVALGPVVAVGGFLLYEKRKASTD